MLMTNLQKMIILMVEEVLIDDNIGVTTQCDLATLTMAIINLHRRVIPPTSSTSSFYRIFVSFAKSSAAATTTTTKHLWLSIPEGSASPLSTHNKHNKHCFPKSAIYYC